MAQVRGLARDHPVEAHRARQLARERGARGGVRPARPALGQHLEGAVQEREGGQDRGGLAVRDVAGGPPAPRARVVHRRQVVEDQARGVHHLDRAGRGQHGVGVAAQDLRHHQGQDRPQPLGGREEAVLERGLHRGRAPGAGQPPQRLLDLQAPLLERASRAANRSAPAAVITSAARRGADIGRERVRRQRPGRGC